MGDLEAADIPLIPPPAKLNTHARRGKVFTPPLVQIGAEVLSWIPDVLPEMLWFDALLAEYRWARAGGYLHTVADTIDRYLGPGEDRVFTGTMSSFGLVPNARRPDALAALVGDPVARAGFPLPFLNAVSFYPECPMNWLVPLMEAEPRDAASAVHYLEAASMRLIAGKESHASQTRIAAFARIFVHGRIALPDSPELFDILPRYPTEVTDDERKRVESAFRALFAASDFVNLESGSPWVRHFWRHNYKLSACRTSSSAEGVLLEPNAVPTLQGRLFHTLGWFIDAFRDAYSKIELDLYNPDRDEVLAALVARQVHLFAYLLRDTALWSGEMGPIVHRLMADTLILTAWLSLKGDSDLYRRFKLYSAGKLKLFRTQLTEISENLGTENRELDYAIYERIDDDLPEEMVSIDVGAVFPEYNSRTMAIEAGLENLYRIVYSPTSAELHGEWAALKEHDLTRCWNPLHRFHRLPLLDIDPSPLPGVVKSASAFLEDTFLAWLRAYGLEGDFAGRAAKFRRGVGVCFELAEKERDSGNTIGSQP